MAEQVFVGLAVATIAWWVVIISSSRVRKALWPRYRLRPLPWRLSDIVLVWLLFLLSMAVSGVFFPLPSDSVKRTDIAPESFSLQANSDCQRQEEAKNAHWVLVLIQDDRSLGTLLLCLVGTGILAPIVEEILFRGFLQGWCHTLELRARPHPSKTAGVWHRFPVGAMSVGLIALVFAMVHYRPHATPPSADVIRVLVIRQTISYVMYIPALLFVVMVKHCPRRGSFIHGRKWFWPDLALGAGWFLAAIVPLYLLQAIMKTVLSLQGLADPCTMIPVGAILGTLFARTGRLTASIVFHVLLNVTSVTLAFLI